jgi:shikimate kinase
MPVRTRRMENSGKGVRLPERSSSSEEDIEMSPSAKSMVDELRSYLDTRIQERLEALNENARTKPPMVQKDDTTQLLLQILNDRNGRMKKLEQVVSNTNQNIAALVQGMSQKITTIGIEIGQGSG